MDILKRYIDQQNSCYSRCLDQQLKRSSIFVVIPCYNEPDILTSLNSLAACQPPEAGVTVLVVVNDSEDSPTEVIAQNTSTLDCIGQWQLNHPYLFFDVQRICARSLPRKWAGVGWARKIGMDEVIRQISSNHETDGIIVSFDADSTVSPNYLQVIESSFVNRPDCNFFTVHFEHPYNNAELSASIREGIVRYELHMRYFRNAMQFCGYPHAIHTVGSSFALKASAYVKQGGMNRRKAGEDFYFLHKLVLLGRYGNISSTTVIPASRQSDRVPFGTGAAIKKWTEGNIELKTTYALQAFYSLRPLFANPSQFWQMEPHEIAEYFNHLHPALQTFCKHSQTVDELFELKNNCSNPTVFEKRFFHLLNAFWILKYLNFAHESSFNRSDLQTETVMLLQDIGIQTDSNILLENLLDIFRDLDRKIENSN